MHSTKYTYFNLLANRSRVIHAQVHNCSTGVPLPSYNIIFCASAEREKPQYKHRTFVIIFLEPCGHASCLDMEVVLKVKTNNNICYCIPPVRTRGFDTKYGDN